MKEESSVATSRELFQLIRSCDDFFMVVLWRQHGLLGVLTTGLQISS